MSASTADGAIATRPSAVCVSRSVQKSADDSSTWRTGSLTRSWASTQPTLPVPASVVSWVRAACSIIDAMISRTRSRYSCMTSLRAVSELTPGEPMKL